MRNDYEQKPPQVLVVDDELEMIQVYKGQLEEHGFIIESAANGSEADFKITHHTFDLVITDLNMPYIDGIEFVKNLRGSHLNKNTPVVVVSGFLSKAAIVRLASFKVGKIYTKPLQFKVFIKEISEMIGYKARNDILSALVEKNEVEVKQD